MAGAGELGSTIIKELAGKINKEDGVTKVMEVVRETLKQKYDQWFQKFPIRPSPQQPSFMRPLLSILIGGYDVEKNKLTPRIYSLNSSLDFPPSLHEYGFALDGVPQYALYLLNRLYSDSLNVKQLQQLLAYVISETATQDGKVGGPIQIGIILKGNSKILSKSEIEGINKKNENNSKRLRQLFYGKSYGKK
jgi:hypothetical protein